VGSRTWLKYTAGLSALILFLATPAFAQLSTWLQSYTGRNAAGYFGPLIDAFGADLNAGLYHTGRVPEDGLHVSLGVVFMSARFSAADRTFTAFTESGFSPEQAVKASTVVGSQTALCVDGDAGTRFCFPGGFDLRSFDFGVPQLRVGALWGTEATIRFGWISTSTTGDGGTYLYGFGVRHGVSRYIENCPVDVAAGGHWQRFVSGENERGGDLISAQAWTVGLQASKRWSWSEPYVGIAYDDFGLDVSYEGDTPEDTIEMSFDASEHYHVTMGLAVNVRFAVVHGEYNIGGQNAFALGLALGYHPLR
jgi:hypothetical protein